MVDAINGSGQPRVIGIGANGKFLHERNDGGHWLGAQVGKADAA